MENSSTAHIEYALASAFLEKLETDIKDTDLLHLEKNFQDFLLSLARRSFGTIIEELDSRGKASKRIWAETLGKEKKDAWNLCRRYLF